MDVNKQVLLRRVKRARTLQLSRPQHTRIQQGVGRVEIAEGSVSENGGRDDDDDNLAEDSLDNADEGAGVGREQDGEQEQDESGWFPPRFSVRGKKRSHDDE
jgi:hypothetical protein